MPLPSVTLNDIGGLPEEMKDEIHQTLAIVKEPERSKKLGIKATKGYFTLWSTRNRKNASLPSNGS